jgi:FtsH-binding integral membrane protein
LGAIYSLYLIIDTQLILGGKKKELSLDNYILGATMLYVDII